MRAIAAAYQSREVARDVPESQTRRRREAFLNAASAFEYCVEMEKSAEELSNHYGAAAPSGKLRSYYRVLEFLFKTD